MKEIISFLKKFGAKWKIKPKIPPPTSFPIGPYRLDMKIAGLSGLRELTKIEYRAVTRQFKGERIYYVPDVEHLGYHWKVMLNVVNSIVYKISAYIETKDKDLANRAVMDAFLYCKNQMGEPTKQRSEMFIWNTLDGNVSFQTNQTAEMFEINLLLTSNATRNFSSF